MPRKLCLFATCALAVLSCLPGNAQDSPSLGDLARQAQKDKTNAPPAKRVFTNDDLPSGAGFGPSGSGGGIGGNISVGLGQAGQTTAAGKSGAASSPQKDLEKMEAFMRQIDSLDQATLVKNVLRGLDVDFPGRSQWEGKLYAAKQVYAAEGHEIVDKAKQIVASVDSLQGNHDPNDPRVKELGEKLKDLVRNGVQADAAFQAVMLEGRDLATQAQGHEEAPK